MLETLRQMDLKLLQKRIIQKTEEATGDLISNKIPKKKKKEFKNFNAEYFRDRTKWSRRFKIWYWNNKKNMYIPRKKHNEISMNVD